MSCVSLVTGSEGRGGAQTERGRLPETQGEDLRQAGQRRGKPTESDQIHPPQTTGTCEYLVQPTHHPNIRTLIEIPRSYFRIIISLYVI